MRALIIFFLFWSSFAYSDEVNLKCVYSKDASKIASLKINFKTQEYQWQGNKPAPFNLQNNILIGKLEYPKDIKTDTTMHITFLINRDTGILLTKSYYLKDDEVKKFVETAVDKIIANKKDFGKNGMVYLEVQTLAKLFKESGFANFQCEKSKIKF